jgi:hypothetical protein
MSGAVRALLAVAGVVVMLLGMSGRLMFYQWFGISTATMIGWAIYLVPFAVLFIIDMVIMDRQRQLKRDTARILYRLGQGPKPAERGKVIQLRRESR